MKPGQKPYRNLILLLSRRCRLHCPECNIQPELDNGQVLTPDTLKKIITCATRQTVRGGIIWTGGEPFDSADELFFGLQLAQDQGFFSEILTSGSWHTQADAILNRLSPFRNRLNIRLSLDGAHQLQLDWNCQKNLIERILEGGFTLNFTLRSNDPYTIVDPMIMQNEIEEIFRRIAPGQSPSSHLFHTMPHMTPPREGQIRSVFEKSPQPQYRCRLALKDLVIAWDGLRYACCGLFMEKDNKRYSLEHEDNRTVFRLLRRIGPLALARKMGMALPDQETLYTHGPCPLCRFLWKEEYARLTAQGMTVPKV